MERARWLIVVAALATGCGGETASDVDAATGVDAAAGDVDAASEDVDAASEDVDAASDDVDAASDVDAWTADELTLTSSAYAEGGVIPLTHVCTDQGGDNTSPPLAWVGVPAGTMSFGVFFTDATTNFRHSAIYDIPADVTSLPEDVEHTAMPADVPGARQPRGYPGTFGYAGPCPGNMHSYRFTLYALDVATLPGLSGSSSLAQVEAALTEHAIATATLTGTHTPP